MTATVRRLYLNKSDIRKITGCTSLQANIVMNECSKDAEHSGYEQMTGKIYYKRLAKFLGMPDEEVMQYINAK